MACVPAKTSGEAIRLSTVMQPLEVYSLSFCGGENHKEKFL